METNSQMKTVKDWYDYYKLFDVENALKLAVQKVYPENWEEKYRELEGTQWN